MPDEDPSPDSPPVQGGLKKLVSLVLAGVFFGLGVLGALLPVLPATPFLLLTSYFLVRASPQLNEKLLRSPTFGPILVDWQQKGGIRKQVRLRAIIFVVVTVGLTVFLSGAKPVPTAIVLGLAAVGIFVIAKLPLVD